MSYFIIQDIYAIFFLLVAKFDIWFFEEKYADFLLLFDSFFMFSL